jgi:hypothetical protein
MDDRYVEAIIDELERIGDLLQDLLKLHTLKAIKEGVKEIPHPMYRRPEDKRSAKVASGPGRGRP